MLRDPFTPAECVAAWHQWYGDVGPRGYRLREALPERWLRIHSLPHGKRYPTTPAEENVVLKRYHRAFDVLLTASWSIVVAYGHALRLDHAHQLARWCAERDAFVVMAAEVPDLPPTVAFAGPFRSSAADLDRLLLMIADDRLRAMWINPETGAAVAPYDGGADLFFPDSAERDRVRGLLSAWLPKSPTGL